MKTIARLLYFEGCPNVEQTRENLRLALARAGLKADWEEVNLQDSRTPAEWRGFPSPTVLAYGRDVATGAKSAPGSSACRFGGAPSVELIAGKLTRTGFGRWLAMAGALPAAAIGSFPAAFCPACYPALAGLLSSMGLGAFADDIAGLAYGARRTKRYLPTALGGLGALGMYAGLYWIASAPLKWAGVAALIAASIWNILPAKSGGGASGPSCPACETKEGGNDNGKA
ncbi:MAG: MerC domain-containing protein [Elusimicrobia bacterium]|nr:MerC domain-containing protein [Elusimicrobiota bacterium]